MDIFEGCESKRLYDRSVLDLRHGRGDGLGRCVLRFFIAEATVGVLFAERFPGHVV